MAEDKNPTNESVLQLAQERGFDVCPVCREVTIETGAVTPCGHRFCADCPARFVRNAHGAYDCPVCKTSCQGTPLSFASFFGTARQFSCPGGECEQKALDLEAFAIHVRDRCPSREFECGACGTGIRAADRERHLAACRCGKCGRRHPGTCKVVRCPSCGGLFRSDFLTRHEPLCGATVYSCQFAGCPFRGPVRRLLFHETEVHRPPRVWDTGRSRDSVDRVVLVREGDTLFLGETGLRGIRPFGCPGEEARGFRAPMRGSVAGKALAECGFSVLQELWYSVTHDRWATSSIRKGVLSEADARLLVHVDELTRSRGPPTDPAAVEEALDYVLSDPGRLLSLQGADHAGRRRARRDE